MVQGVSCFSFFSTFFSVSNFQSVFCLNLFTYQRFLVKKNKILSIKNLVFSYPLVLTYVLGAQKNRLIETVLLSTNNICFG